jgi:hypothetical protein
VRLGRDESRDEKKQSRLADVTLYDFKVIQARIFVASIKTEDGRLEGGCGSR